MPIKLAATYTWRDHHLPPHPDPSVPATWGPWLTEAKRCGLDGFMLSDGPDWYGTRENNGAFLSRLNGTGLTACLMCEQFQDTGEASWKYTAEDVATYLIRIEGLLQHPSHTRISGLPLLFVYGVKGPANLDIWGEGVRMANDDYGVTIPITFMETYDGWDKDRHAGLWLRWKYDPKTIGGYNQSAPAGHSVSVSLGYRNPATGITEVPANLTQFKSALKKAKASAALVATVITWNEELEAPDKTALLFRPTYLRAMRDIWGA